MRSPTTAPDTVLALKVIEHRSPNGESQDDVFSVTYPVAG
jgi:hypothetical protein